MRIAVCLSGHSRNYKDNFPNFNFDADIFMSTCYQSGNPGNNTPAFISYHSQGHQQTELVDEL